ncbi:1-deoxy-D-xylulose-5-phosphate reductoisomerase [Chromobacterium sp. IIBBL 290-4]|uniref:1-deoxy-D-xylulose-5-phosphate reductoisomerase n=1 Tax=Chromobacterium sp. IIBBL 290-4 TaxID=2953890 RepID=UPI0020B81B6F|nr:1-deoxy-D-xylulose-5-phosphate reductoisomerase [Chromobacterium sp. IIBBL 290-4]UTH73466.1 1-deoxy-D-xylulose-5-phosphate reductoisomerase [Chromobacterium sp. IIBBL 290-4]
MSKPQGITVLGATGSVGCNTLDVISRHPERYRVVALTAHRQLDKLFEQACRFRPEYLVVADEASALALQARLASSGVVAEVLHGPEALIQVATLPQVDAVMAAIVGSAGLPSALAAACAGKRILLANKESLVVAGRLFMDAVRAGGAQLLPVDSEHSAIFQSLPADYAGDPDASGIRNIILTASGGPFRSRSAQEMLNVTPEDACRHPNWSMGRKISVDSATLMNKGLEVIEARWLFNVAPSRIQVAVHPQSVIHSMVQYKDGSVLAQLGSPDMRTPIACALAWPERIEAGVESLDFFSLSDLSFEKPDLQRFPCLRLAFDALETGGDAPAVLNAANEAAVAAFLDGRLRFVDIAKVVEETMAGVSAAASDTLEALLAKDAEARRFAEGRVAAC